MPLDDRALDFRALASFKIEALARLSQRQADALYQSRLGLRLQECHILGLLGSNQPIAFKALCGLASIDKSYASRLVARLVDGGFVEKQDDPADQRSFVMRLTAAGEQLHRAVYAIAAERNARWLAALTAQEGETLIALIDRLTARALDLVGPDRGGPMIPPVPKDRTEPVPDRAAGKEAGGSIAVDRGLLQCLHQMLGTALDGDRPGGTSADRPAAPMRRRS